MAAGVGMKRMTTMTTENSETVTIPKLEYDRLVRDCKLLQALHAGGVDNWEWYSDSIQTYFPEYWED